MCQHGPSPTAPATPRPSHGPVLSAWTTAARRGLPELGRDRTSPLAKPSKGPRCNWNKRRDFCHGDKAVLGFCPPFKRVSSVPASGSLHLPLPLLCTLSKASVSSLFKSQIKPHLPERPSSRRPCGSGQTPARPLSHAPVCLVFLIFFTVFSVCTRLSPAVPRRTHARRGRQLCAGWTLVRSPLCPRYLNRTVYGAAASSYRRSGRSVGRYAKEWEP